MAHPGMTARWRMTRLGAGQMMAAPCLPTSARALSGARINELCAGDKPCSPNRCGCPVPTRRLQRHDGLPGDGGLNDASLADGQRGTRVGPPTDIPRRN
eukprot:9978917-Lingulodinium_polyedra.AAC.3